MNIVACGGAVQMRFVMVRQKMVRLLKYHDPEKQYCQ